MQATPTSTQSTYLHTYTPWWADLDNTSSPSLRAHRLQLNERKIDVKRATELTIRGRAIAGVGKYWPVDDVVVPRVVAEAEVEELVSALVCVEDLLLHRMYSSKRFVVCLYCFCFLRFNSCISQSESIFKTLSVLLLRVRLS